MIAFMYWLYFALPLFWSNHFSPRWDIVEQLLPSDTMTAAISMALAGVAAIWLGMKANLDTGLFPKDCRTLILMSDAYTISDSSSSLAVSSAYTSLSFISPERKRDRS